MVWDANGLARLDAAQTEKMWDEYRERVGRHYGFDDQQLEQAQKVYEKRRGQLRWVLDENASDLQEYRDGLQRLARYQNDTARTSVESLQGQLGKIQGELWATRNKVLPTIDKLWADYAAELNGLATDEQRAQGRLPLGKPGRRVLDSESIDQIVRYMDVTIGLLLIIGLLTRPAAIVAAGFLASVVVSQWPGTAGAAPVWPQAIEMLALLVIAATGAGRFAGFDFLVSSFRCWCCPPQEQGSQT
jgi:uncharacterized membrane protein YphA (DoxX/SURF4 family)